MWGCVRKIGLRDSRLRWDEWCMPEMASRLESGEIAKNTVNNCGGIWRTHVSPMRGVTVMSFARGGVPGPAPLDAEVCSPRMRGWS